MRAHTGTRGAARGTEQDLPREGARRPTHLQHVPRDVLLTAVAADAELGVVVGLAVGQPVPATRRAVRTRGAGAPETPQPLPTTGTASKGEMPLPPTPDGHQRRFLGALGASTPPPPPPWPHEKHREEGPVLQGQKLRCTERGALGPAAERELAAASGGSAERIKAVSGTSKMFPGTWLLHLGGRRPIYSAGGFPLPPRGVRAALRNHEPQRVCDERAPVRAWHLGWVGTTLAVPGCGGRGIRLRGREREGHRARVSAAGAVRGVGHAACGALLPSTGRAWGGLRPGFRGADERTQGRHVARHSTGHMVGAALPATAMTILRSTQHGGRPCGGEVNRLALKRRGPAVCP